MEMTIHTGNVGDQIKINIAWFDENLVRKVTVVELKIKAQDKPRILEVNINDIRFEVQ